MDKSAIKNFAVSARVKLKQQIEQKAYTFGITKDEIKAVEVFEDTFEVNGNKYNKRLIKYRDSLVKKINEKGFEQVLEEVAYTWFNRLIAIRFMEVNEYLPTGVRVLSSTDISKVEPDIIREAVHLEFENMNIDLIYKLQDENNTEELYKYLLIKQCNELGKIMPVVFEEIEDFTELLLPDNLIKEGSIVRELVTSIDEQDWKEQVEIIGWLYQYYISEKKDEVFADLKKNIKITKENIPAATQLFTPDWIVKYMVENSLGRLWLESHPDEELKTKWKYYLEEAQQEPEVQKQLVEIREKNKDLKPEDIKVIDPCMGSGHILVYQFEVLYDIYKSAGYSEREIPKLILTQNIYGLDIDDRAAQLAYFAVMMKARSYNKRIFRERIDLNISSIQESNDFPKEAIDFLVDSNETEIEKRIHREDVVYLINVFNDAKEYGSILEVKKIDFDVIERRIEEIRNDEITDVFEWQYKNAILDNMPALIKQGRIMSQRYDIVCTNPPYMGYRGMNTVLANYVLKHYRNSKLDLFAVFIEKCLMLSKKYVSLITQQSWMFLTSYEDLRMSLLENKTIATLLHLGSRAFEEIKGEKVKTAAFVFDINKINNFKPVFVRLSNYNNHIIKEKEFFNSENYYFQIKQNEFDEISGKPIAYWSNDYLLDIFKNAKKFEREIDLTGSQHITAKNEKYLREFWEVNSNIIGSKWITYAKGGNFRKWYGNITLLVDWSNEAKEFYKRNKTSNMIKEQYWFRTGITWTATTTSKFSCRLLVNTGVFDKKGPSLFVLDKGKQNFYMGFMNSNVVNYILGLFSDGQDYQNIDLKRLPVINFDNNTVDKVTKLVEENIKISKKDWDFSETSMNFKNHPFIMMRNNNFKIENTFNYWMEFSNNQFILVKENESEINKIFIDLYKFQEELISEVSDNDVKIGIAEGVKDIKSFISYAVGCMFGRYSLDEQGLIYAGGEFNSDRYKTFKVDADNIIPITDDEYFEDDIVSRFVEFVMKTFKEETLEENLDYIADTLVKKGNETSRQTIRRYFLKDFYKNHLQTYKKRPIYWLFDSGKNDGFKALIYMHRYDTSTVARVRTDYLHLLQRKYEAEVITLDMVMENSNVSSREKAEARKKKEKVQKQIIECIQYDQVIAHVANQKISIDLDHGVKVNYAKFQGVEVPQGEGKKVLKADLLAKI